MLMALVYAIENLTYNGTFFGTVSTFLWIIAAIVAVLILAAKFANNQNEPKEIIREEILKDSIEGRLVKGFRLSRNIGGLVAGEVYISTNHFQNIRTLWVYPKGQEDNYSQKIDVEKDIYDEVMQDLNAQHTVSRTVTETEAGKMINLPKLYFKPLVYLACVCMMLDTLLPTRQTAIYMAAAYAVEQVVTADKTQKILGVGYKALENQLGKWANEVPEVADMLVGTGIEYTKKAVVEKVEENIEE